MTLRAQQAPPVALAVLWVGNLLDWWLTKNGLERGIIAEANPIMDALYAAGAGWALLFKCAMWGMVVALGIVVSRDPLGRAVNWTTAAFSLSAVAYNLIGQVVLA